MSGSEIPVPGRIQEKVGGIRINIARRRVGGGKLRLPSWHLEKLAQELFGDGLADLAPPQRKQDSV